MDEVAQFATTLLERCPRVQILATSRQVLGTPGEYVLDLRPLPDREAEQLFLERAERRHAAPDAEDADERAVLAQLCRDLDDLPLAIELAAAQCRALSLQQLVEQLGDRFALLQSGRSVDGRHASMAATVAWSYDTLAPEERNLFEALGLLEGSFDLEGVLAVWGQSSYLAPFLGLINKSLVTVLDSSPKRYHILNPAHQLRAQRRSDP